MRRISSSATFFFKRILPAISFGVLMPVVAALAFRVFDSRGIPLWGFLIMAGWMIVLGYFLLKRLVFDLVDEVLDAGDVLIIRNGTKVEHVPLSDIMKVRYWPFVDPPRVTLLLRNPGIFGTKVSFCPPIRFVPFTTSPVIDELIERIDAARRRRR